MGQEVRAVQIAALLQLVRVVAQVFVVALVVADKTVFLAQHLHEPDGGAVASPDVPERVNGQVKRWHLRNAATLAQDHQLLCEVIAGHGLLEGFGRRAGVLAPHPFLGPGEVIALLLRVPRALAAVDLAAHQLLYLVEVVHQLVADVHSSRVHGVAGVLPPCVEVETVL